ncbi:MAG: hypothetical protein ACOZB0_09135 [Pseudomonadota bacterium]
MPALAQAIDSRWLDRAARGLFWGLLLALATSLAWWTWRLLPIEAPAAELVTRPVSEPPLDDWFTGQGRAAPVASGRFVLRWTYPGHPGVCILAVSGLQDRAFRVGDEVEPGYVLREVGERHVLIEGSGGVERIERPESPPPTLAPVAPASVATPPVPVRIRREE